jgi:hypothetical protein
MISVIIMWLIVQLQLIIMMVVHFRSIAPPADQQNNGNLVRNADKIANNHDGCTFSEYCTSRGSTE